MKSLACASALALVLTASGASADALSPLDAQFVAMAAVGNTFEIQESRLALRRSTDLRITAFARRMIADHALAQRKLERAAAGAGVDASPALDPDHLARVEALGRLTGPQFDQAYVTDQVAAHQESSEQLQGFASAALDPALMRWAAVTLPVVNSHLIHISAMAGMDTR